MSGRVEPGHIAEGVGRIARRGAGATLRSDRYLSKPKDRDHERCDANRQGCAHSHRSSSSGPDMPPGPTSDCTGPTPPVDRILGCSQGLRETRNRDVAQSVAGPDERAAYITVPAPVSKEFRRIAAPAEESR